MTALGFFVRLDLLGSHFSELDDMIPLMLYLKFHPSRTDAAFKEYRQTGRVTSRPPLWEPKLWETYEKVAGKVGHWAAGLLFSSRNPFTFPYVVSSNSTYAPLQYGLYPLVLRRADYGYRRSWPGFPFSRSP
jgi:hypothetical protein